MRFEVGIALHFGDAAYGNVGSRRAARLYGDRPRREPRRACRILCGQLNQPLLFSNAFKSRLTDAEIRKLGAFKLKGVSARSAIFAPFAACKGRAGMSGRPDVTGFFHADTFSIAYIVADPATKRAAIVDPVLDYDERAGRISTGFADSDACRGRREGA